MDFNEYTVVSMIKQRHAELIADARRDAMIRATVADRHVLRVALGTALIRAGAWLLREEYPAAAS